MDKKDDISKKSGEFVKILEQKLSKLQKLKERYIEEIVSFQNDYDFYLGDMIKEILLLNQEIAYRENIHEKNLLKAQKIEMHRLKKEQKSLKFAFYEMKHWVDGIDEWDNDLHNELVDMSSELSFLDKTIQRQEESYQLLKQNIESLDFWLEYKGSKDSYWQYYRVSQNIRVKKMFKFENEPIVPKKPSKDINITQEISSLVKEIKHMEQSETFKTLLQIKDKEVYLLEMKQFLKNELDTLKTNFNSI